MTIDELLALTGLTGSDEIPVWDAEASGEPTKKITAQNFAAAIKTLASLLGTGDVVNDLTSTDPTKVLAAPQGKALNDKIDGIFTLIQNISVSPNSYTDIDYPSGYSQYHTMVVSVLIANIYHDYTNITVALNTNKIRISNPTQQSWEGVKILLTRI